MPPTIPQKNRKYTAIQGSLLSEYHDANTRQAPENNSTEANKAKLPPMQPPNAALSTDLLTWLRFNNANPAADPSWKKTTYINAPA